MKLKDTVELMLSDNRADRLKAEYYQTKIRYNKLWEIAENHKPDIFEPKTSSDLNCYLSQINHMARYLASLEWRARDNDIKLEIDKIPVDKEHLASAYIEASVNFGIVENKYNYVKTEYENVTKAYETTKEKDLLGYIERLKKTLEEIELKKEEALLYKEAIQYRAIFEGVLCYKNADYYREKIFKEIYKKL